MSSKLNEIVEEIKSLSTMELVELVSKLQEVFGVSASSISDSVDSDSGSESEKKEEKSAFKLELVKAGSEKMKLIRALRSVKKELLLMEAKAATENLPYLIFDDANKADAENAKRLLEEAGAEVSIS